MNMADYVDLNGTKYELDCKGYLVDFAKWDVQLRDWFAEQEGVDLTDEHYEAIEYLRKYYNEHGVHPEIRMITSAMAQMFNKVKGTAMYFHVLFPAGLHQADKIAGLPLRHSCC